MTDATEAKQGVRATYAEINSLVKNNLPGFGIYKAEQLEQWRNEQVHYHSLKEWHNGLRRCLTDAEIVEYVRRPPFQSKQGQNKGGENEG